MTKYFILHPAVFKLDGGAMFGIIPKPLWSKQIPADDLNRILMSLRVMFIQTKSRNILIDTGIGDYHGEKFDSRFGVQGEKNPLIQLLRKNFNLGPEDITDLIISHLHFDHVGGLGSGEPHQELFPKAKLHLHKEHYQYALNPTVRDAGSFHSEYFKPLIENAQKENRVHWLEGKEGIILEDGDEVIRFKCSYGHTPHLVHAYDEKFIYMADLVPTMSHIPLAWVMGYDIAPGQTTKDKEEFYQFLYQNPKTLIFEHDLKTWGCVIENSEKGVKVKEHFDLDPSQEVLQILDWPDPQ